MSTVTYINHATVLIELNGYNIITDPVYAKAISYWLPRFQPPGIPFDELPSIDCILISHNHYDHLNLKTLRRLRRKRDSFIVVPKGLARYARRTGFTDIVEMKWWETNSIHSRFPPEADAPVAQKGLKGLRITCVPAKHTSGRGAFDMNRTVYCGYVIELDGRRLDSLSKSVYFAGDTAYGDFFKELGEKFSIDVALLPIGAYRPRSWFKHIHMSPGDAVQAFIDLKAKHFVPIHWGTFKISDEPMREPPVLLRQEAERAGVLERIHVLKNGERFEW